MSVAVRVSRRGGWLLFLHYALAVYTRPTICPTVRLCALVVSRRPSLLRSCLQPSASCSIPETIWFDVRTTELSLSRLQMWNGRDRRNTSICGIPTTITLTNTASNDYAEQCCWGWLFCIYCRTDSLSDGPTTSYASHRWSSLYLQFTKNKIVERLMKYANNTQTKELQQTSSKQLAIFTERVVNVWNSLPNTTDFNSLAVLLNV